MPISFLIKWPAIFLIGSLGAGLAFLPIEGRPMDVMLMNFLKTLPAENRFIFHKKGADALLHEYFIPQVTHKTAPVQAEKKDNRKELLLNQLVRKNGPYKVDAEERDQLNSISTMFDSADTPVTGMSAIDAPTENSSQEVARPTYTPAPVQADVAPAPTTPVAPPQTPPTPIQTMNSPVYTPPPTPPQLATQEPSMPAVSVAPENQVASGFPQIPDTPNIVLGIAKDARGKVLPNIIVEVIDSTGNPVRAFKTNALGQFASATPLPEGKYKIILEDTRHLHEFTPIEIEMTNEIFQPLEIISTDQREKLRQELFGANQQQ